MAKVRTTTSVAPLNSYTTLLGTQANNTLYAPAADLINNNIVVVDGLGGNDTIYSNAAGAILIGNVGDDKLYGNIGTDILMGGVGNDYMDGGAGIDQANYFYETAAVKVDLALTSAQNTGGAGTDTIINIENLLGTKFNDTLLGDSADNAIQGDLGNDIIDGRAGNDTIEGGDGNDTLYGGDGNDYLFGRGGNDAMYGGAGDDFINAGFWHSTRVRDLGPNNDIIDGGTGTDTVGYSNYGNVTVNLSTGITTYAGFATLGIAAYTQTLVNIENVNGTLGQDTLIGNDIANVLSGNAGNDFLVGNGGSDILIGGAGGDQMSGGAGADTFVMDLMSAGKDIVLDFSSAEGDKINISGVSAFLADGAAFTGLAGQVHVLADATIAGLQHIEIDYNGDMTADVFGDVYSNNTLSTGDFFFYV